MKKFFVLSAIAMGVMVFSKVVSAEVVEAKCTDYMDRSCERAGKICCVLEPVIVKG